MNKPQIVISIYVEKEIPFFQIADRQVKRIRAAFPKARIVWCHGEDSFVRSLRDAEIVLANRFQQAWFDVAPKLRLILSPAAGLDVLNVTPPPGVRIHCSKHHGPIMAETVLGMMLAVNRGILTCARHQAEGELWPCRALYTTVRTLRGTHAVILGFGSIGQAVGRLLKAFGVRLTGIRLHPDAPRPDFLTKEDRVVGVKDLDAALHTADHLIVVLPSNTGTERLIDARRIQQLPHHAVIYNVGRGNCMDEAALARAVQTGRIAGACLDVFAHEPLTAASPLAKPIPNLLRMPHASCYAPSYADGFTDDAIEFLKKDFES